MLRPQQSQNLLLFLAYRLKFKSTYLVKLMPMEELIDAIAKPINICFTVLVAWKFKGEQFPYKK